MLQLTHLLKQIPYPYAIINGDAVINGLVADSRLVQPGFLFVAVAGANVDGHTYISEAIERGAAAVVGTQRLAGLKVPYVRLEDSRQALAWLAAAYYGFPARQLTMIGVTGTDGKTTTTNLIYQILLAAGHKAGMISTINAVIGDQVLDTGFHVTTPDAPDIQRYLHQMAARGLTHVVLEVTSHGLAQYRADACEFDVAVITNVTHEHLDYHGTYEEYRAAKARLFTSLSSTVSKSQGNPRKAILNRDDPSFDYLLQVTTGEPISYGFSPIAEIRPKSVYHGSNGLSFVAVGKDKEIPVQCQLVGDFNVSNCLAAITATVFALDVEPSAAARGIAALHSVPGRMEKIDLGQEFTAIVDFAHTPNALKNALQAARNLAHGRVIAVFGAAGLRDRQKRRLMAEVSMDLADLTILTAEDPRTEQLEEILAEMASGAVSRGGLEGKTFWRVADRGNAIRLAVSLAKPGDLIIACGKGHEQSMCFGEMEYPWDDRTAMRSAISEHLGIQGPEMPCLPTQRY
jgi:UDP-N-acetylmuramoyl-L-alanyl-D-glutamate--2,6-diaminopimelate ligase